MKPILFYDIRSPPVRSCLMLINHLNLDIDLKSIDLFKREHLHPDFIKLNPIHTVPTLKDNDLILTDSHSILIHLCQKYGDCNEKLHYLWPKDDLLRVKIINMLFFESSILFRRDSEMFMDIFQRNRKDVNNHKLKLYEAYNMLETILNNKKYTVCDEITLADFSVITTLSTIDIIFPITNNDWPNLYKYYENMKLLPCYKDSNEEGRNCLKRALIEYAKFDI